LAGLVKFAKVFILAIRFRARSRARKVKIEGTGKTNNGTPGQGGEKLLKTPVTSRLLGGLLVGSTRSKPVLSNRVLSEEEKEEMKEMKGIKMKKDEKRRFVECGASVRMRSLV